MAAMVATSMMAIPNILVDGVWYMDLGASHHSTLDINNLSHSIPYQGFEQVMVGNCINILNIGNIFILPVSNFLHLNHVLHTPKFSKKSISVNYLCIDNNAFIELYTLPYFW